MSGSSNTTTKNGGTTGETAAALQGLGETVTGLDGRQVVTARGHTDCESRAGLNGAVPDPNVVVPPTGGGVDNSPEGSGVVVGAGVAPGAVVNPAPGVAGTGGQGVGGATQGTS